MLCTLGSVHIHSIVFIHHNDALYKVKRRKDSEVWETIFHIFTFLFVFIFQRKLFKIKYSYMWQWEELGGIKGGEIVVRIYCMRKQSISKKKKVKQQQKKKRQLHHFLPLVSFIPFSRLPCLTHKCVYNQLSPYGVALCIFRGMTIFRIRKPFQVPVSKEN